MLKHIHVQQNINILVTKSVKITPCGQIALTLFLEKNKIMASDITHRLKPDSLGLFTQQTQGVGNNVSFMLVHRLRRWPDQH